MAEVEKTPRVDTSLLLGFIATKDLPTIEKKVALLARFGFSNKDMATICGASENVVKTLKSKARKA
jgi:DNA-directed RNA polymerase specialized sigma24 family protein